MNIFVKIFVALSLVFTTGIVIANAAQAQTVTTAQVVSVTVSGHAGLLPASVIAESEAKGD